MAPRLASLLLAPGSLVEPDQLAEPLGVGGPALPPPADERVTEKGPDLVAVPALRGDDQRIYQPADVDLEPFGVNLDDSAPGFWIGQPDMEALEPAGPQQRPVDDLQSVGRADDQHLHIGPEPV